MCALVRNCYTIVHALKLPVPTFPKNIQTCQQTQLEEQKVFTVSKNKSKYLNSNIHVRYPFYYSSQILNIPHTCTCTHFVIQLHIGHFKHANDSATSKTNLKYKMLFDQKDQKHKNSFVIFCINNFHHKLLKYCESTAKKACNYINVLQLSKFMI